MLTCLISRYFDTPDFILTTQDFWLRQRCVKKGFLARACVYARPRARVDMDLAGMASAVQNSETQMLENGCRSKFECLNMM
jgi:hypothetical protein